MVHCHVEVAGSGKRSQDVLPERDRQGPAPAAAEEARQKTRRPGLGKAADDAPADGVGRLRR